jgi:crotonobetaine/carnitine-CoA ligase
MTPAQRQPKVFLDLLDARAAEMPNMAVLRTSAQDVTYASAVHQSNRAAHVYRELGLRRGEHCLLMLDNGPAWIPSWWGLARIGAVEVPINTAFRGEMLRYVIDDSDARVLVIEAHYLKRLADIAQGLEKLEIVIVHSSLNGEPTFPQDDPRLSRFAVFDFSMFAQGSSDVIDEGIRVSDVAAIIYTSGTTGRSKGVIAPYGQIFTNSNLPAIGLLREGETMLMHLPMFHIGSQWHGLIGSIIAGGTFALADQFHASRFFDDARRYDANTSLLLASMASFVYRQDPRDDDADNPVTLIECSPAIPEYREFEKRFDVRLTVAYGLTEGGSVIASHAPLNHTMCGKARSDEVELMIVDDQDNPVPNGHMGELVIRSKTPWTTMLGYYKQPEATLHILRNQWLHTGDIMRRDDDGNYFFIDRIKDCLRRRGENVSSAEVEGEVMAHPDVLECAAVPFPSESGEDEIRIFVVPRDGQTIDPVALITFLAARMPYFMVPRYVDIHDALPRTETGKIKKESLRAGGATPMWDRELAGIVVPR